MTTKNLSSEEREQYTLPATGSEFSEQCALLRWAAHVQVEYPVLRWLYHVPNGELRHKSVAKRLRAAGVKAGVPDLCLPVPADGKHGLYLELKADGGRPTPDQRTWLRYLESAGYEVVLAVGWIAAARAILTYLGADAATIDRLVGR